MTQAALIRMLLHLVAARVHVVACPGKPLFIANEVHIRFPVVYWEISWGQCTDKERPIRDVRSCDVISSSDKAYIYGHFHETIAAAKDEQEKFSSPGYKAQKRRFLTPLLLAISNKFFIDSLLRFPGCYLKLTATYFRRSQQRLRLVSV